MMMKRQIAWTVAVAATLALSAGVLAQDFKTFKGDNARVGRNGTPAASGPGRALLRWWHPNAADVSAGDALIRNNTAPFPWVDAVGSWVAPAANEEAKPKKR